MAIIIIIYIFYSAHCVAFNFLSILQRIAGHDIHRVHFFRSLALFRLIDSLSEHSVENWYLVNIFAEETVASHEVKFDAASENACFMHYRDIASAICYWLFIRMPVAFEHTTLYRQDVSAVIATCSRQNQKFHLRTTYCACRMCYAVRAL